MALASFARVLESNLKTRLASYETETLTLVLQTGQDREPVSKELASTIPVR
jgi:hypothetical protein